MSLRELVQSSVTAAFNALDDLPETFTLIQVTGSGVMDSAGVVTIPTTSKEGVRGALRFYRVSETDGEKVKAGDMLVSLLASDLGTMVPKPEDRIQRSSGIVLRVMEVHEGAGAALYRIQARKAS